MPSYEEKHIVKKLEFEAAYDIETFDKLLKQVPEEMVSLITALNKEVPDRTYAENKQLMAYFRTLSCFAKLSFV